MSMVSKNLKIAIVAASAPPLSSGGVASAHYNLFRALKSRGYQIGLFTFFDNSIPANLNEDGIVRNGSHPRIASLILKLVYAVFKLIQPGKQTYQTADILRSAIGAFKMGRAIARFRPDVVILSDHGAPGLWVPKKRGQRFLLVSHHNPLRFAKEPMLGTSSLLDAELAVWLENLVLRKVDWVICPSRYIGNWFQSTYSYSKSISVIPNVVDFEYIDSIRSQNIRELMGLSGEARIIYLPSAGTTIKGAQFVWPIIEKLAQKLSFSVGFYLPGQVQPEVGDRLMQTGAKIFLPGQLDYEQHLALVKSCDLAISPALMENLSMAILESVALGVPVLAFDRGGNEDIIENGKNGYLVDPFDIDSLTTIAAGLLSTEDVGRLQATTQAFTKQKFRIETSLSAYLQCMGVEAI